MLQLGENTATGLCLSFFTQPVFMSATPQHLMFNELEKIN
jgi:hypothetical protein